MRPLSLDNMLSRLEPRHKSLLATIFGDILLPRGGAASMGSLIAACEVFRISPRAVRTATHRLTAEGLVEARRRGRCSDYMLTKHGRELFEQAGARIYGGPGRGGESWHLVLTTELGSEKRSELWKVLSWHGFGHMGSNVLMGPARPGEIEKACASVGLDDGRAVVIGVGGADAKRLASLVRRHWKLEAVEKMYTHFLGVFETLERSLRRATWASDEFSFAARVLLVHSYRRILIRDPGLPDELLPDSWHGGRARTLCRNVYPKLHERSESHVNKVFKTTDGPLPASCNSYSDRFERHCALRAAA